MSVLSKTFGRLHAVFVDHNEIAKAGEPGVLITGKGEAVIALQPAMLGMSAVLGSSDCDHDLPSATECRRLILQRWQDGYHRLQ